MKSYLHVYQVLLFLYIPDEITAIFGERIPKEGLVIHEEDADNHGLSYPLRSHVTFKFHHPSPIIEDDFYYDPSKVNKKRPKYGKLKTTLPDDAYQEVDLHHILGLGQLFRQVSLPQVQNYGSAHAEDVKPVTEVIEDDIKYDFRTKTHSIRLLDGGADLTTLKELEG